MKQVTLLLFFLLVLAGCIEPYEYPFEENSNSLVVDAAVSSSAGPHLIKLTTTRNIYDEDNAYVLYVNGAQVSVSDDEGNIATFKEKGSGYYYSDSSFRAMAGRSYQLRIVTKEGTEYESESEVALPASEMNQVQVKYTLRSEKNKLGNYVNVDGFSVSAIVNDRPEERNYYLLRMRATYKVLTNPSAHEIFDPKAGGYIGSPKSCCNICWVGKTIEDFVVYSDQLVNGRANAEIPLVFYPIEGKYFYDKVYFEVTQYSLSSEAYSFWKALHDLKFRQGTLFDPAPSSLPGNIYNVNDSNDKVVGYFTVSDVSSRGDFITKDLIPRNVIYDFEFKDDCRALQNSTTEQPSFWR